MVAELTPQGQCRLARLARLVELVADEGLEGAPRRASPGLPGRARLRSATLGHIRGPPVGAPRDGPPCEQPPAHSSGPRLGRRRPRRGTRSGLGSHPPVCRAMPPLRPGARARTLRPQPLPRSPPERARGETRPPRLPDAEARLRPRPVMLSSSQVSTMSPQIAAASSASRAAADSRAARARTASRTVAGTPPRPDRRTSVTKKGLPAVFRYRCPGSIDDPRASSATASGESGANAIRRTAAASPDRLGGCAADGAGLPRHRERWLPAMLVRLPRGVPGTEAGRASPGRRSGCPRTPPAWVSGWPSGHRETSDRERRRCRSGPPGPVSCPGADPGVAGSPANRSPRQEPEPAPWPAR
jgi:hypothetical protein